MRPETFAALGLLGLAGVCVLYVVPAIVAFRRGHPNRWAILAVNVFMGATGIGWAAALMWALHAMHRVPGAEGSHGGASGLNVFASDVWRVRVEGEGMPAASCGATVSTAAAVGKIERLARLRVARHLSEAEFAALKMRVLARL